MTWRQIAQAFIALFPELKDNSLFNSNVRLDGQLTHDGFRIFFDNSYVGLYENKDRILQEFYNHRSNEHVVEDVSPEHRGYAQEILNEALKLLLES